MPQKIEIQLFGAFRDFAESGKIHVEVENLWSASQVKAVILSDLKNVATTGVDLAALIQASVLANEESVLQDQDRIDLSRGSQFAILPPVCGG